MFSLLSRNRTFITNRLWKCSVRIYSDKPKKGKKIIKSGDECYAQVKCPPLVKDAEIPKESDKPSEDEPDMSEMSEEIKSLYHRPTRLEPAKVRLGFLPEDWFQFFYPKTGVTGPYTFMVTLSTYLISKEKYVMEHEYYLGLSMLIGLYLATTYLGPSIAELLDKKVDAYASMWENSRNSEKAFLTDSIEQEFKDQRCMEGQLMLLDGKRQNVGLQLEEAYRKRLVYAHEVVLSRLNFQVRKGIIEKRFIQENAVEWIVDQVIKSYNEKRAKEDVDICIDSLRQLATKKLQS